MRKPQVEEKKAVGMVGDGINHAPALAQADVGIAIGTGTDVAIRRVGRDARPRRPAGRGERNRPLPRHDPHGPPEPVLGVHLQRVLGIPMAAGVLYPLLGWSTSAMPIIASAAMSFSSVSVVANSLRLRSFRPPLKGA